MKHKTEEIEVGNGVYRTVEYALQEIGDRVNISMRYDGQQLDPFDVCGPIYLSNLDRAHDLVVLVARWLYDEEKKSATD